MDDIAWLNVLSVTFAIFMLCTLVLLSYFLLRKINDTLTSRYFLHVIMSCLSIYLISKFEYYVLIWKYNIDLPEFISSAIYGSFLLCVPIFLIFTIRAIILLIIDLFKKNN